MADNPYESGAPDTSAPKTRATRWLVWSGVISLILAVTCVALTTVEMTTAVNSMAGAATPPTPSELADGINTALIPSMAAVPFGVLGIVLLVAGFMVRQTVDRSVSR
jgi:hypothetical protein